MKKSLEWLAEEKGLFIYWLFAVAAYSALSLFRHWHFQSSGFDLGIADHAVWHYSRFEIPSDTISHFNNLLGDHFDPTLALLAPLYWICPHVEILLVAQAVLLTIPLFPIYLFTRKRLGRFAALCFAVSYAMLWELQAEALFDFHELTLAVPAAAFAIYFADEEKWGPFFASVLFMVLCKEDLCLVAVFMGLVLVLKGKRVQGAVLAVLALALFLFEVKVLIPYLGDRPYSHWRFSQLGSGPLRALGTCLTHPFKILSLLFSNSTKTITILCLFLPFLFGALFSPWGLLMIPLICERMLSDDPDYWVMMYQYNVMAAPVICLASADGFYRLFQRMKDPVPREKFLRALAILILVFNIITAQLPHQPLGRFIRTAFWNFSPVEKTGKIALGLIPKDASVLAQSSLIPHLSHREVIDRADEQWKQSPPSEDYAVFALEENAYPLDRGDLVQLIELKKRQGYGVLLNQDGWFVLKKKEKADGHAD
jgi:uncharacterized membrane protein